MPPVRQGAPPVSTGGEGLPLAITSKSENADVAAAYIDLMTTTTRASCCVQTGNLPAARARRSPSSRARCCADVVDAATDVRGTASFRTWTGRRRRSTTPHRGDPGADGASGSRRRSSRPGRAGLRDVPELADADGRPAAHVAVASGRASGAAAPSGGPNASRAPPRRAAAGRLPVPRCRRSCSSRRSCSRRSAQGVALAVRLGRRDAGTWVGLGNYSEFFTDPAIRAAFLHVARADGLLRGDADRHRAAAGGGDVARRVRGLAVFRTVLFLPQVIAVVVAAVAWMDLRRRTAPLNDRAAGGRARASCRRRTGSATSRSRCRRSACSARG